MRAKLCLVIVPVSISLILIGCGQKHGTSQTPRTNGDVPEAVTAADTTHPAQSATPSRLDREAVAVATGQFKAHATRCGDSWLVCESSMTFAPPYWGYIELKGLQYQGSPPGLSEADSLNGIEWRGDFNFEALHREFPSRSWKWSEWQERKFLFELRLTKVRGQWRYEWIGVNFCEQPKCEDLSSLQ